MFEIEIYDKILMTEVNMIITSLTNSRIKEICKLKEKKYRNMTNTFLIEGINLVTEAGEIIKRSKKESRSGIPAKRDAPDRLFLF